MSDSKKDKGAKAEEAKPIADAALDGAVGAGKTPPPSPPPPPPPSGNTIRGNYIGTGSDGG